jgi:hypothetical protein
MKGIFPKVCFYGLRQLPDPLSLINWVSDLSQCPIIHITDIFIYSREKCGWTPRRLRRDQEDDGANSSKCVNLDKNLKIKEIHAKV